MDIERQIATRLRSRRRLLGLTLQEVADACGTSFQTIQKYETGVATVSAARLWALSQALQVDPSYFYDGLATPSVVVRTFTRSERSLRPA